MGVVCWASDGSPSILPRLASSSRGPSQLAHHHNSGQTAPVFGFWKITAQSNTEAQGKIRRLPAVPAIGQTTWYNSWLASTSTTSGAGTLLSGTRRDPKTLDEHCFISFSHTHELVGERRRYMIQFVLEDICHLHVTLLTDDQQSGEYGLNVNDGHTVHDNNRLHPLHSLNFPLDVALECARNQCGEILALSAADVKRILDFYFCWRDLPVDDVVKVS